VRIAIVGAGGRLGAALAREWGGADEALALGRADLDLAAPGEIERVLGPLGFDALVNCAALTNVDYCETHAPEAMRVNAEAVGEIGALCTRKAARCVHISTDYVFDGTLDRPYTEEDAPRAISVYGESKLQGERALRNASADHLAVRVSWVFGPARPSFIDGIVKRALDSDHAEAIGDKWSTPSYTRDLATMLRPFLREIPVGGVLHASNAGACTWREYGARALECAARAGLPVRTTEVAFLPIAGMKAFVARRPVYSVLATGKIERLTGQAPRPWEEAVEEYVREYLAPSLAKV